MKSFQIPHTTSITEEQIDDIMTTALEGGITYWAAGCVVKDQPEGAAEIHWASEVISKGGSVKILDREDGKWLTLDRDAFLKGVAKAEIDLENYDAIDADRVIQFALFGKMVYS